MSTVQMLQISVRSQSDPAFLELLRNADIHEHPQFRLSLRIQIERRAVRTSASGMHHDFRDAFGKPPDDMPEVFDRCVSGEGQTSEMIGCRNAVGTEHLLCDHGCATDAPRLLDFFVGHDVSEGRQGLLQRNSNETNAISLEHGDERRRDRRMKMNVMMPVHVGRRSDGIEEPFDLRADFPFKVFLLHCSRIQSVRHSLSLQKHAVSLEKRSNGLGLAERIFFRQIQMQACRKAFFTSLLSRAIGIRRVRQQGGIRHDAEFHALEDSVRPLGIGAEIVRVDDERSHTAECTTTEWYTAYVRALHSSIGSAAAFLAFVIPCVTSAMSSETFDFAMNSVNARWEGKGSIGMRQENAGILLHASGTGLLVTNTQLRIVPSMGSIRVTTDMPTTAYFLWSYADDAAHVNYTIPIDIPAGTLTDVPFSLSNVRNWGKGEKSIGIVLEPSTTILIHSIRFDALNPLETLLEMTRSFWTFDVIRTYSINFLWGPYVAFDPVERAMLFRFVPPTSLSGTYVLFIGLVVALIALSVLARHAKHRRSKRSIAIACSVMIACSWFLLDLRMGLEFLHSVGIDRRDYVAAHESTRTFRDRHRFYDFAAFAAPLVSDRTSYIFFAEQQWPYLGNMRYLTYPAIPGIDIEHDDTWVIYRRSDVSVNDAGQLTIDGLPVTGAGTILDRFDEHSFVFRASAPSLPASL